MTRVYIASPMGFSPLGRTAYRQHILEPLAAAGFDILDPWALAPEAELQATLHLPLSPERNAQLRSINRRIGQINTQAIDRAQLLLAILDGPDIDSGTAAEIGYASARDIPVLGYRGDFRAAGDNDGSCVNLQVEYFIERSGGHILRELELVVPELRRIARNQEIGADPGCNSAKS